MSETLYKIKRSGGMEPTTWIGATGCRREFDPEVDTFIVNEVELGICLHNGNFKLLGPADAVDIPSSPLSVPASIVKEEKEDEDEEEDTSTEE